MIAKIINIDEKKKYIYLAICSFYKLTNKY